MPADMPSPEQHVPSLANTSPVWRRAWHPVAHAEDIAGDAPTQVLVGGDAWVVVRLGGRLAAFADQCPHRLPAPAARSVPPAPDGAAPHVWGAPRLGGHA